MFKKRRSFESRDYLDDILEMIADIREFTAKLTYAKFKRDKKTVYAVIRCLEGIGEASKQIPSSAKKAHDQIPWDSVAGMRNKLIHEYFGADVEIVWRTIRDDLKSLESAVREMRKEIPD